MSTLSVDYLCRLSFYRISPWRLCVETPSQKALSMDSLYRLFFDRNSTTLSFIISLQTLQHRVSTDSLSLRSPYGFSYRQSPLRLFLSMESLQRDSHYRDLSPRRTDSLHRLSLETLYRLSPKRVSHGTLSQETLSRYSLFWESLSHFLS